MSATITINQLEMGFEVGVPVTGYRGGERVWTRVDGYFEECEHLDVEWQDATPYCRTCDAQWDYAYEEFVS